MPTSDGPDTTCSMSDLYGDHLYNVKKEETRRLKEIRILEIENHFHKTMSR